MQRIVVAIVGVSGVGKTTFTKELSTSLPLLHLSAGSLIDAGRRDRSIDRDELRLANVADNQELLVRGFIQATRRSRGVVVVDGHVVVRGVSGIQAVPSGTFSAMGVNGMIHISSSPSQILRQRRKDTERDRPLLDPAEIDAEQKKSLLVANRICLELQIPILKTEGRNVAMAIDFIASLQSEKTIPSNPDS